jgi:hypothetical protein
MNLQRLRRLEKLEEKRAKGTDRVVERIVWKKAGDKHPPGVYRRREPDPEEEKAEFQLSLDFEGALAFPIAPPERSSQE